MGKELYRFFLFSTVLVYCFLFYTTYKYYNDVELVEIPVGQCKVKGIGGGTSGTKDYTIYYKDKIYYREYKSIGVSNLLWNKDFILGNQLVSTEIIYLYHLKSESKLTKTSRYFLPSANKPITNKVILILDIWGYLMTNWFWYFMLYFFLVYSFSKEKEHFFTKEDNSSNDVKRKVEWYEYIILRGFDLLILFLFFY